jgi:hypothetical protein
MLVPECRMKAEERKHLKENEFQTWLGRAWRSITSGSTTNTIVWSVILIGLVLAIGWRYYSSATFVSRSAAWYLLDNATTVDALNAVIKENKSEVVGRIARFDLARYQMQDALSRLAGPNFGERVTAADDLQTARDAYRDLAKESGSEPTLAQEAMMNVAKAEETLSSVPKVDNDREMRGSLAQAIALYQELVKKYPNSYLGGQAAARVKEIDDHRTQVDAFYIGLSKEHGKPPPPAIPEPLKGPELPKAPDAPKADVPKPDAKTPETAKTDPPKP